MKYLVTGAAGFLGKHVTRLLKSKDHEVFPIDNLDPLCGGDQLEDYADVDVSDYESIYNAIRVANPDVILHLAAYGRNLTCQDFPLRAWNVNVNGTLNVLESVRRNGLHSRVICVSSNIVLSDQPTVYKETKLTVESLVRLYSKMGVSTMAVRPSNIYGAWQSKTEYQPCAFAGMDKSFAETGHFTITGDGTQARDWTHAKDVARGLVVAAESSECGDTVDICTGKVASMNMISDMLGVKVVYVPARPGDAKVLISDPTYARNLIGFTSEITLGEGIWDAFPEVRKSLND